MGTPARMLIRSFPANASRIPSSCRTAERLYGLHASSTTSASLTPLVLLFCRIVKADFRCESSVLIRFADVGRVTHAMKREGVRGGSSSEGVEVPLVECAELCSDKEERMPERMAIPRVP